MIHFRRAALFPSLVALAIATTNLRGAPSPQTGAGPVEVAPALRARAQRDGRVRVLVGLNLSFTPEGALPAAAVLAQRGRVAQIGARLLSRLPAGDFRVARSYVATPHLALEVGPGALAALENAAGDVVSVTADEILHTTLAQSVPIVQGDQVWQAGYDGTGSVIAVLDTGVDSTHPFLTGKVVEEACYSSTVPGTSESFCPNGQSQQVGPGSGAPCPLSDCFHGTHVAGIAAGNGAPAGVPFSGVAKGAQLMAVQVFSKIIDPTECGGTAPCAGAFSSDLIAGLERVYAVALQRNITSVNMSLGGGLYSAPCDTVAATQPYKPPIDNLRAIGIASAIASGNSGAFSQISAPACISSAVSVGSTDKTDVVSWFSNVASFLSLFAPGDSITSSVPGGGYAELSGTSMATPHVAGAWALFKQAKPTASVTEILTALRQTGLPITDTRFFGTATIPRIRVFQALATLVPVTSPAPSIASLSPDHSFGANPFTLTVSGSGFNAFSVVQWNGSAKPTSVVSTTQITASIPASDLPAAGGTAQVRVFTPAPGGGTSASLTFTITPAPVLTIGAPAVAPGDTETVTLTNGQGGAADWLALAAVGSPDTSYLQWTYVGAGVTNRTWTVTMPSTAGQYEFRLFLNNSYTHVALSARVTVDPTLTPGPIASSLSPASAGVGGPAFTLTVTGSRFVPSSVVRWNGSNRATTFVSATTLQAAIGAGDLSAAGTAQVTVFTPAPGGGTSASLPFTVAPLPALTPTNPTTATGGSSFTTTLTNGVGGASDWLALAATGAPPTSFVQWTYVGGGITTRTWTVTLPSTAGTYEFRLFLNNTYTITTRSAPITVSGGPATLTSLSPASAAVGASAFTLNVYGNGFVASSVVQWNGSPRPTTFVSATQLQAAISAADLAAAATVPITVYTPPPGGGTSASLPFTVMTTPSLTPTNPTTAVGGSSFTTTLTNGAGGGTDWLALAATSAAPTSYVVWTNVGAGVTTRTWTVTLPSSGGTYEFRLFLNNTYTITARSAPITVSAGPATLTSLSPASQPAGASAFTLNVFGNGFAPASVVQWNGAPTPTTFVSATQLQATIGAGNLAVAGVVAVTVSTPGTGTSASLPFSITLPPSLTPNVFTVAPGGSVTVTLANGLGGQSDWLALAAAGAPDTIFVQWIYVGNGVTTRTWTVTMPTTPGTYEFRYYLNNSYTRAATSQPVTVAQ